VRNKLLLALSFILLTAITIPTLIFAQQSGTAKTEGAKTATSADKPTETRRPVKSEDIEMDLSEALTLIQDNYVDGDRLNYNELFKSSITGMLHTLDPHSNYFDPKEFEEFRTDQRSEYHGIGATIGDLRDGKELWTYIRATFHNSPAWRAGLRYGDRIVEVDGKSMKNKPYIEVRNFLRGPRGTAVKVTFERAFTGKLQTVEITRDAVSQPSIPEAYMIQPGVGYIAMTGGFNLTTGDEFKRAMDDLKRQNMQMLVLDLRGNGGGLVRQAIYIANHFLREGQTIMKQHGRVRGSSYEFKADNETPDTTPLVALVNRGSASASEILAGALQDHDRALIVGEGTFGKGLVQNPFTLEYGSALMLTIAKYSTPSGRLIQRDYSSSSLYDYYTNGGILNDERQQKPTGPESRTDTGRVVYGGGGITPDEIVKPSYLTPLQRKLPYPIFAFALELAFGRVKGFENYKVDRAIEFNRDLTASDFPMTDELYAAFKSFVTSHPHFKVTAAQLDKERDYASRQLRSELVTAAYGTTTSFQVFNQADKQILKAIEILPRARELAQTAANVRNP
jgi:carboxyl-terminal processing protease